MHQNLVIAIGASAGGLKEIVEIVSLLPEKIQGSIIVATHRSPDTKNLLASVIANSTNIDVIEPVDCELLDCAHIYVGAPGDSVTMEGSEFRIRIDPDNLRRMQRIDDLFKSVAEAAGVNAAGVILSGSLEDGMEGLKAIHDAGGTCIVQHPMDAEFSSMPTSALANVNVDCIGTAAEIAEFLIRLATARECG